VNRLIPRVSSFRYCVLYSSLRDVGGVGIKLSPFARNCFSSGVKVMVVRKL
jgi:hypothetical protein